MQINITYTWKSYIFHRLVVPVSKYFHEFHELSCSKESGTKVSPCYVSYSNKICSRIFIERDDQQRSTKQEELKRRTCTRKRARRTPSYDKFDLLVTV